MTLRLIHNLIVTNYRTSSQVESLEEREVSWMRQIRYEAPWTLREAVTFLSTANGQTALLAGGADLLVQITVLRRANSESLSIWRTEWTQF
jgi:hypothetical protein